MRTWLVVLAASLVAFAAGFFVAARINVPATDLIATPERSPAVAVEPPQIVPVPPVSAPPEPTLSQPDSSTGPATGESAQELASVPVEQESEVDALGKADQAVEATSKAASVDAGVAAAAPEGIPAPLPQLPDTPADNSPVERPAATPPALASDLPETPAPEPDRLPGWRLASDREDVDFETEISEVCGRIGSKLASVSSAECDSIQFDPHRYYSVQGTPLLQKHYPASAPRAPRVLFIGGIHGDEYSSVSVTFKWLSSMDELVESRRREWLFLPLLNPDGLLQRDSRRVNANDVDLNRNFEPAPGSPEPLAHWRSVARERARYFPGTTPLSEPESRAIADLIRDFRPDLIVAVHAPHGVLDFDGGNAPPRQLGPLSLQPLGTYPGSLGNHAWFGLGIPVVTIELEYAGIMPSDLDIRRMWTDLLSWMDGNLRDQHARGSTDTNDKTVGSD